MPIMCTPILEKVPPPSEFSDIWAIITELRQVRDAPVDLWGCEKVVDASAPRDVLEFQTVVAAMLSSQTKDHSVKQAMDNLLQSDLSIGGVLAMTEEEIDSKIRMVGFHTIKAKNIRQVAKLIKDSPHFGRVPSDFEQLVALPGIGPKMANLILTCAFNRTEGICVDTHVHRISTLLGWGCRKCKSCKNPEHTRKALELWVPNRMWRDYTYLIVGLGQMMQGSRQKLLIRCLQMKDALRALIFLNRVKFNFNNLGAMESAAQLNCSEEVIHYLSKLV